MEADQDRGQALQKLISQSRPSERHLLHPDTKPQTPSIDSIEPTANVSRLIKLPSPSNMEQALQEQLSHLESRLEDIKLERDQARDAIDNVLCDLDATETKLEEAKQEASHAASQITELRDQLLTLSQQSDAKDRDIVNLRQQNAEALGDRIAESQALQKRFDELSAQSKANGDAQVANLRKMTLCLETQLKAKDEELAKCTARVKFLQHQEAESKDQQAQPAVQALDDQKRLQAAKAKVQELWRELQQAQAQLQTSQAATPPEEDHAGLRRLLDYHKANGENVLRNVNDLQTANRQLQASLQDKERMIQEQDRLIADLKVQLQ